MRHHAVQRFCGSAFVVIMIGLAPRVTSAASPEDNPAVVAPPNRWQKQLAYEARLGLATPLGFAGVAVDVTPVPWVSLNLGIGQGGHGAQYAGMARVRLATTPVTGGIGAGVSAGRYQWDNQCKAYYGPCAAMDRWPVVTRTWNPAIWGNVEAFLEGRAAGGFQWRVYLGLGKILNAAASRCTWQSVDGQRPNGCDESHFLGYVGTALGYSFSL